ncbi:adenosylcobinamide-GDP ribazoletransferase [Yoonia sp. MH D7]
MTRLAEFQVAVMMLTRLPAGQLQAAPSIGASAWAFPVVGGIIGAISATVMLCALWLGLAGPIAAGLALCVMVMVTGGLHEDGLADLADGFGGGRNKAHKLEVMRDSQIGSYGVLALVFALGLRWQGIVVVVILAGPWVAAAALVALAIASRSSIATALWLMPAARTDGMGKLATGAKKPQALTAAAFGIVTLIVLFGWAGCVMALVMVIAQLGLAALANRQIGGQTGDVLGALQQIGEIAGWIALGAFL